MMRTLRTISGIVLILSVCGCAEKNAVTPEVVAMNDRGVALMGRYEYSNAHDVFTNVVERAPNWRDAHVNLAIATLNRQEDGDEQEALEILAVVLDEEPGHLRALYVSGLIYLYIGEPETAADTLRKVLDADPADAYAAYFLGQSLLQAGSDSEAPALFLQAIESDPYLRSAYWAAAQLLRRHGRVDEATSLLADYQRFEPNPAARLADFSYKRMGPKAEALSTATEEFVRAEPPSGPLFAETQLIDADNWQHTSLTAADINGDGQLDLFASASDRSLVLMGKEDGRFEAVDEHPLSVDHSARTALWGDMNDDGFVDVALCGPTGTHLWLQDEDGQWTSSILSPLDCTAGAVFDADHDGDLDLFVTGPGGNELLSNNRDGSFRQLAESLELRGSAGRQIVIADLDADRDLDIIVFNVAAPNDVWQNDRMWQYRTFSGLDDLRNSPIIAATVADANADGHNEIYGLSAEGNLSVWQSDGSSWSRSSIREKLWSETDEVDRAELSIADFDGDGRPEIFLTFAGVDQAGFQLLDSESGESVYEESVIGLASAIPAPVNASSGPAVFAAGTEGISIWPAGSGRFAFLSLFPSGRSEAEQMRSNASGIGTLLHVRSGGQWTVLNALDPHSGPGQSLTPLSAGLGGNRKADYVALEWSDGVSQTEIDLAAGLRHEIAETQRQLASCPVIFAWDGNEYRFISDVLGVGGMGFFVEPGVYAPPRPSEGYLLDSETLVAREGNYIVKLTEPMEEAAYLDAALIHVFDLPDGWSVVLDERMGVFGPEVTGRPITYRRSINPSRARNTDGEDVTALVLATDHRAPPPGEIDHRFIGLLAEDQTITMEFDEPLSGEGLTLVADGWIEYPYSQTVFAAWQAGVQYRAATLEARDASGQWSAVAVEFGYPAGMPRTMVLPIGELPTGTDALRLSSNLEIYWDRLQVVWEEPLEDAHKRTIAPTVARIAKTGFAKRTTGPQRLPVYDYQDRSPYWDTKFQRGFYTAFGDATELVTGIDGAMAIIGGGEEIHLEFPAESAPAPGMRRFFALDFRGWAKDMDLYTKDGDTIGPLPDLDGMDQAMIEKRDQLHEKYNVRFQEGL